MSVPEPAVPRFGKVRRFASAALLAAGTLAFVTSLALPGVVRAGIMGPGDDRPATIDGWTCALSHGPTAGTNWFLACAFAVWGAAVWWRSIWAWYLGAAGGIVTVLVHGFVGAWPDYERIVRLRSGYWTWLAASAAMCASFLLLPRPVRVATEERLPVEDLDRGRAGLAAVLGAAATAAAVAIWFLIPTFAGTELVPGEPPEKDVSDFYQVGPVHSSSPVDVVRRKGPDGTESVWYRRSVPAPVVAALPRTPGRTCFTTASLLLPAFFAAAFGTRRTAWRWSGAAVAAGVTAAAVGSVDAPWSMSGTSPHPLAALWIATPPAFLAAFLLVPPRRGSGAAGVSPDARR